MNIRSSADADEPARRV